MILDKASWFGKNHCTSLEHHEVRGLSFIKVKIFTFLWQKLISRPIFFTHDLTSYTGKGFLAK